MGVPSFYRWLVDKYPKVVVSAVDDADDHAPPNGIFDNLYLDMNGIIHPCFHPEDQVFPPTSCEQVFIAIFDYVDRLVRIVRPRKLLYMAVDGVAPRAKMNQQRCRRFRAAKEAEFAESVEKRVRREFEMRGKALIPKQESEVWDSNVITPGTVFMEKLSKALEYYIRLRLNSHPLWKGIKVILSGVDVPGEGEHKIMKYIRLQRTMPGYDPHTRHCLYGQDADLIMLSLATHEIHFSILREDALKENYGEVSFSSLDLSDRSSVNPKPQLNNFSSRGSGGSFPRSYQFLNIWTLREYLLLEFTVADPPCEVVMERIIDDFVFICFFTGNDFLPRIPSIETHEGALDMLVHVYKSEFKHMGGYIVDTTRLKEKKAPYIKVKRVEIFTHALSKYEQKIFEKRNNLRQYKLKRMLLESKERQINSDVGEENFTDAMWENAHGFHEHPESLEVLFSKQCKINMMVELREEVTLQRQEENTREMILAVKNALQDHADLFKSGCGGTDRMKLHMPGSEDRYYRENFSVSSSEELTKKKRDVVHEYMKGICWTLNYYYGGVCSWNWYYPFHCGPLISSMKSLCCSSLVFTMSAPLKPFDQLMAVLPPRSSHALPKAYKELMTSESSTLLEFYPTDFEEDLDGKRFRWQSTVKLPFIKEDILLAQTKLLEKELTEEERRRNDFGFDKIFALDSTGFGKMICCSSEHSKPPSGSPSKMHRVPIICSCSDGINGFLTSSQESWQYNFPSPVNGLEDIEDDHVVSAIYENPEHHDHIPRLLTPDIPPMTITAEDIEPRKLWHEYPGSRHPTVLARPEYMQKKYPNARDTSGRGRGRGSSSYSQPSASISSENWKGAGRGNNPHICEQPSAYPSARARDISGDAYLTNARGRGAHMRGRFPENNSWSQRRDSVDGKEWVQARGRGRYGDAAPPRRSEHGRW